MKTKAFRAWYFVLLFCLTLPFSAAGIDGDADGNGVMDMEDARCIARFMVNQIPAIPVPGNADATQDGIVDLEDAFAIAKRVAGQSWILVVAPRYGRPAALQAGDLIRIEFFEHFFPTHVSSGTVRITSASSGYDSGSQPLTTEEGGRSLFFHWDTAGLQAVADHTVTVTVGSTVATSVVSLANRWYQPSVLASAVDAYCPAPGFPLVFRRVFPHDPVSYPYLGPLGRGWVHNYDISLSEFTDGRIAFHGPQGFNRFFKSKPDGTYESAPGDYGTLSQTNGTFELKEKNGFICRFRSDLRLDYEQDRNGNRVAAVYDVSNRLAEIHHSCGTYFLLQYDDKGWITNLTDNVGRSTTYQYDSTNPVLARATDPGTRAASFLSSNMMQSGNARGGPIRTAGR